MRDEAGEGRGGRCFEVRKVCGDPRRASNVEDPPNGDAEGGKGDTHLESITQE